MKNNLYTFVLASLFSICMLNAQDTPKPTPPIPPAPPISLPTPPEAPEQLGTVVPPEMPTSPHKPDTTKISIGDKQIIIIDNKDKKAGEEKADWEKDLEQSMQELKENLENVKIDMEESKEDMKISKEELEESKKEMEQELKQEHEDNDENQAPCEKNKFEFKLNKGHKQHKGASIGFLNFDFGINILGGSPSEQLKNDLKLKTWGSWSYTFNFLPTKIYLGTSHLMLLTSFGWRLGQLEFKENLDFSPDSTLVYHKDDNLKKSQFVIHHLQIPLTIYWKSNRIKGLGDVGFGIGTYAGILVTQKLETETAKPKRDITTCEDYGFTDFRYGLSARLDIGAIKLFANFDLNKLWKDNEFKNIECGIWLDL